MSAALFIKSIRINAIAHYTGNEGDNVFHPGIIIWGIVCVTYLLVTTTYVGYINYFVGTTKGLFYSSWVCAVIFLLCFLYKARNNPKQKRTAKGFFVLLFATVFMAAMFRLGPVGSIAVVYHMLLGEQVTVLTKVTRSNNSYFMYRGCRGKLNAFKKFSLRNKSVCGISYEDWQTLAPDTLILLIGTQSYFGINFERYAIPPENSAVHSFKQYVDLSGVIYLKSPIVSSGIHTKELIYRSFE